MEEISKPTCIDGWEDNWDDDVEDNTQKDPNTLGDYHCFCRTEEHCEYLVEWATS